MNVLTIVSPGLKVLFERVGKPEVINRPEVLRLSGTGAVIACNHIGWVDSLWVAYAVYPRQLRYMYAGTTHISDTASTTPPPLRHRPWVSPWAAGRIVAIETADAALLKNRVTGWRSLWSYRERPFSTSAEHRAGAGPQGGFPRDYAGMPTAGRARPESTRQRTMVEISRAVVGNGARR